MDVVCCFIKEGARGTCASAPARCRATGAQLIGTAACAADVKFLADQSHLVTAGADKTVRLWTAAEGGDDYSAAAVLKEHTGEVCGQRCVFQNTLLLCIPPFMSSSVGARS